MAHKRLSGGSKGNIVGGGSKDGAGTGLAAWLGSAVLGSMMTAYGVGGYWATTFIVVGVVGTSMEIVSAYNPYRRLFQNCKIEAGGQLPLYQGKRKTNYGYNLRFSLPAGLSTNDFENNKLAIEQYLNKKVTISYNNKNVFISVYEKTLDKSYKYEYVSTKNVCEFPIGYTYGERLVMVDLENVVHMLVAGETGSGKSTLLRGILTNIILDKNPRQLSLDLIDLKNGAEFNVFKRCGIVKSFSRTIEEAERVLAMISQEVDKRYDLFFEKDVVNIQEYNTLQNVKKLDYRIVAIDEFADLQDEKGSISIIETLAAKARACGIHLIIATQRPDAKILNGRIKANVPCVVGLKTMNELNSRIIIDESGLEKLKGKGHGILKYSDTTEFQAMYLSVQDARNLIKHKYSRPLQAIKQPTTEQEVVMGVVNDLGFLQNLVGGKDED